MQKDYQKKSQIERIALGKVFSIIYKGKEGYDYYKFFTPEEGFDCYDGGGAKITYDSNHNSTMSRQLFEVKVRDTHYPELLLEKDKLENLWKKCKELDSTPYYVNVTPEGCFIWKLENPLNYTWERQMHWVSTTDKSRGKKLKSITMLDQNDAKRFNITRGEVVNAWDEIYNKKPEVVKKKCKCGLEVFFN